MTNLKTYWEERGKNYQTNIRGVLFGKNYPEFIVRSFDKFSFNQVSRHLSKNSQSNLLDIGCGYGRLAAPLLKKFPKLRVIGIDVSQTYVNLFNETLSPRGKAAVADMRKLPLRDSQFDVISVVAVLMYLVKPKDQQKAIEEMLRALKNQGTIVLIERTELMQYFDVSYMLRMRKTSGQVSFSKKYITEAFNKKGAKVKQVIPWPSKLLPLFYAYIIHKT